MGRAALTMAKTAGVEARGVITLHKVLPPGGGIGGGSGNAASTLLALNRAWGLEWPEEKLCAIAGTLGSDIPFFVRAEPTFCTGRGEIMQPLPMAQRLFAVLILPPMGCATKDVYAAFDAGKRYEPRKPATDWQQVARSSAAELLETLVNDLEPGAFFVAPWLRELRERAAGIAGRPVLMTGSGSTLYTLCDSGAEASELAERIGAGLPEGCACIAARVG